MKRSTTCSIDMKQDPLEQAAKKYAEMHQDVSGNLGKYLVKAVFQDGAQWQQERMYSEEDMRKCWDASKRFERPISEGYAPNFNEFIEQFKKK